MQHARSPPPKKKPTMSMTAVRRQLTMVEMSLRPSMYESYERLVLSMVRCIGFLKFSGVWEGAEVGVGE